MAGALGSALEARSLAALLLELVGTADAPGTTRRQPAEDSPRLRDAIEDGLATERHVAGYARRLGYSTRTLDRLARANAGVTAKVLIDERVVLEARRMLLHAADPVAAVAHALGFDEASSFSKYFTAARRLDARGVPAARQGRARDLTAAPPMAMAPSFEPYSISD